MRKKIIIVIVGIPFAVVTIYGIVAALYIFLTSSDFTLEIFKNETIWGLWLLALAGLAFFIVFTNKIQWSKNVLKQNRLEDAHFMTDTEKKKMRDIQIVPFEKLSEVEDGIPLSVVKKGKKLWVTLVNGIHSLIIGATRTGKTSTFVDPSIQILSSCKTQPSMVITDPKGELYDLHAKVLQTKGYKVSLIDLEEIFRSIKWNPFGIVLRQTKEVNEHTGENGMSKITTDKGKYYYSGEEFLTFEEADKARAAYLQELNALIFESIQDIVYTVCPLENKHDSTWQDGARELILALNLAFWEDVRDGFMKPKQFNLYNTYKNICDYINPDMTEMRAFFERRDKFSKAKGLGNTVLVTESRTLTSYLTEITRYFNWMSDTGISALTSEDEIDLSNFDEQPSALFIRIPDDKTNRHKLVTLFITQMYKALVNKSRQNLKEGKVKQKERLLRPTYFIMDEFGNLPKFHLIDRIFTIGAGRKIFMLPIIQDYAQLENIYGKEVYSIIKSSCHIKIFIGTTDETTIEEFSKSCGKQKVRSVSFSENKDLSISLQASEKPLIYPAELRTLNDPANGRMGNAVTLLLGKPPLKASYVPLFKERELYGIKEEGVLEKRKPEPFDEEGYFYDIANRNKFLDELYEASKGTKERDIFNAITEEFQKGESNNSESNEILDLINERIKNKTLSLKGKISEGIIALLLELDIIAKLEMLDELIDMSVEEGNSFVTFELSLLKSQVLAASEQAAQVDENTKQGEI